MNCDAQSIGPDVHMQQVDDLPDLELDALENVAGYICYRLKDSLDDTYIAGNSTSYSWVDHLSEGGLCKPSNELMENMQLLEKVFRQLNGDALLITSDYLKKHLNASHSVNCHPKVKKLFFRTRMYFTIRKLNKLCISNTYQNSKKLNKTIN